MSDLQDFQIAKARFEEKSGQEISDDDFRPHFYRRESAVSQEALKTIDQGGDWAALSAGALRALGRFGHFYAATLAAKAGIDVEPLTDEIEETARDDERLADSIRAYRVETLAWNREKNPQAEGVDVAGVVIALSAASIRARVELATREGDVS